MFALKVFLEQGEEALPEYCPLPEPSSSELISALFDLANTQAKLPVSPADWVAVPPWQQPLMLSGLLRFWHRLKARHIELENDVARLCPQLVPHHYKARILLFALPNWRPRNGAGR